ncbi:hypothetical protein IAU60_001704 [Kwoniella sp. DSM 27419]
MPPPPTGLRPANPKPVAKPSQIRYFKGKAPDAPASDSDSDEEGDEQIQTIKKRHEAPKVDPGLVAGGAGKVWTPRMPASGAGGAGIKVELGDVKVGGGRGLSAGDAAARAAESGEDESEDESEDEVKPAAIKPPGDESSEYETDSEEESEPEPPKPVFRPVFKPKNARNMTAEKAAAEAEEAARKEEEAREEKKLASKELAGETIRRELAEREAKDIVHTIDDQDGQDPTAEFDAWRARELARLLRDKRAQAERDEEKAEIERRRAMPEEQRMQEDLAHAAKTREKEKGEMGFLQKYYHKGAFHQDDELLKRDYTGATQSAVDMSMLPKVMQVRDFGKASRSKYTHLADQDTSQGGWGTAARPAGPGAIGTTQTGCWNCGGPHNRKDCPNNNINDPNMSSGMGMGGPTTGFGTSANTAQLGSGSRTWGNGAGVGGYNDRDKDRGAGDREDRGSRYRDEGKERRYDEERRSGRGDERSRDHRSSGREYERSDRRHTGRDERDRDRDYKRRDRSASPGSRRDERDRERRGDRKDDDRYSSDRRRRDEHETRDRDRERERDRDRDRDRRR